MKIYWLMATIFVVPLAGCGSSDNTTTQDSTTMTISSQHPEAPLAEATISLSSPAFGDKETIPEKYTVDGDNVSPPLAWSGIPAGTKELALICDDPDAPSAKNPRPQGPWVHWVVYNIPPEVGQLPEALPSDGVLADYHGIRQGQRELGELGYSGPGPPPKSGPHRYFFRLFALDKELDLDPQQTDKATLIKETKGNVLAEGRLIGVFER